MTGFLSRRVTRVIILLLLGGMILGIGHRFETLSYQAYLRDIKLEAAGELIKVRERIRSDIFQNILKLREMATVISENPDITQAEFSARAADFMTGTPEAFSYTHRTLPTNRTVEHSVVTRTSTNKKQENKKD